MNILLIGQVSLHWGRMEFGNIGNYYIIEPFIREIHRVFSNCNIRTTFQMSDDFCRREKVEVLPLNYYYDWQKGYLALAKQELEIAKEFKKSGAIIETTPFIDEVLKADLVIDFSGDIWGDNANLLGENRFLIGLIKDRVAQLLGKPTALIAGSPGPFNDSQTIEFAKEVFTNFNLVTNREPLSEEVLKEYGFNVKKVKNLACPAFLFESGKKENIPELFDKIKSIKKDRPVAGFVICGWNFPNGPFDKWPRPESDYLIFAETVEFMTIELGLEVCLMSHSNGFKVPPEKVELIQGRDYPIAKQ